MITVLLGSEYLEDLQKHFVDCIQEYNIDALSFAETQPARIVRDILIVTTDSAGTDRKDMVTVLVTPVFIARIL